MGVNKAFSHRLFYHACPYRAAGHLSGVLLAFSVLHSSMAFRTERLFPNLKRLLKTDFELALWRKPFQLRPETARYPCSMCCYWTDYPVFDYTSRHFGTFSAACKPTAFFHHARSFLNSIVQATPPTTAIGSNKATVDAEMLPDVKYALTIRQIIRTRELRAKSRRLLTTTSYCQAILKQPPRCPNGEPNPSRAYYSPAAPFIVPGVCSII